MNEDADLYAVLQVPPDATFARIVQAYRRLALQYHPDRGGDHRKMVQLNEAFYILSDPHKRSEYDRLRTSGAKPTPEWSATSAEVHQRAQDYPRRWSDFQTWMEDLARDFRATQYAVSGVGWYSWPAANTLSGNVFAIVGGLVGLLFTLQMIDSAGGWAKAFGKSNFIGLTRAIAIPIVVGAFAGAGIHKLIRLCLGRFPDTPGKSRQDRTDQSQAASSTGPASGSDDEPARSNTEKDVVPCPACGKKLRVPRLASRILITCPHCKDKFYRSAEASP